MIITVLRALLAFPWKLNLFWTHSMHQPHYLKTLFKFLQYFMSFLTGKIWRVLQYNSNWYLILPVSINVCYTFYFRYSLGVSSPERFVRTRLYFTSESHIHSLLNMLRYGGLRDVSLCVRVISCLEPPFDWVILCWWYVAL